MVDNILEIEPVIKKETVVPEAPPVEEDEPPVNPHHDDPAQMKLEL
jgi:hypothetical protein